MDALGDIFDELAKCYTFDMCTPEGYRGYRKEDTRFCIQKAGGKVTFLNYFSDCELDPIRFESISCLSSYIGYAVEFHLEVELVALVLKGGSDDDQPEGHEVKLRFTWSEKGGTQDGISESGGYADALPEIEVIDDYGTGISEVLKSAGMFIEL